MPGHFETKLSIRIDTPICLKTIVMLLQISAGSNTCVLSKNVYLIQIQHGKTRSKNKQKNKQTNKQTNKLTLFCSLGISYNLIFEKNTCSLGRLVLWRMEGKGFFLASMCNWTPSSSSPYPKSLNKRCTVRYLQ